MMAPSPCRPILRQARRAGWLVTSGIVERAAPHAPSLRGKLDSAEWSPNFDSHQGTR